MSPAFSHCFLKRLSAFSKLSSGSTITLVTRSSPLSFLPEALPVYHAPIGLATHAPLGVAGAVAGGMAPLDPPGARSPGPLEPATRSQSPALRSPPEDRGPGGPSPPPPPSPLLSTPQLRSPTSLLARCQGSHAHRRAGEGRCS